MFSFILKKQPKSYDGWNKLPASRKVLYRQSIENSFRLYYENHTKLTSDLYGVIYYFFNKDVEIDADNLSKPFWDCLNGFLFDDDKQIKIRTAGVFDLSKNEVDILDFSGLPGDVVADLLDSFENETHTVYIECGTLGNSMYKFNSETNGN